MVSRYVCSPHLCHLRFHCLSVSATSTLSVTLNLFRVTCHPKTGLPNGHNNSTTCMGKGSCWWQLVHKFHDKWLPKFLVLHYLVSNTQLVFSDSPCWVRECIFLLQKGYLYFRVQYPTPSPEGILKPQRRCEISQVKDNSQVHEALQLQMQSLFGHPGWGGPSIHDRRRPKSSGIKLEFLSTVETISPWHSVHVAHIAWYVLWNYQDVNVMMQHRSSIGQLHIW